MSEQNESKSKVENKVNVRVVLSWGIPWVAGMLFTMGFSPFPSGLDLGGQVGQWVFYFFAWPLILGRKLGATQFALASLPCWIAILPCPKRFVRKVLQPSPTQKQSSEYL